MPMYLTEQLAQEIVDRTMAILPFNINVMDHDGRIIGSGDRRRLFKKHQVAHEVVRRKETIEIRKVDTNQWEGVKEGINLPILFQGKVLGVVGITGDLDEARGYGQLVKVTTEMMIEQAFMQSQLQLDKRLKEEIVHQLISGNLLREELLFEKAKSVQIDLHIPRVAVVLKSHAHQLESNQKVEFVINEMKEEGDLVVPTYTGEVIILKKVQVVHGRCDQERTLSTIRIWLSRLKKMDPAVQVAIGTYYTELDKLSKSYQEAKETLVVGEKLAPHENLLLYDDFSMYVFVNELAKSVDQNPFLNLITKLKEHDELGELQRTLEVYIQESGKAINTANELFIHRNSLQYRLEKIKEITGKDPRDYKDLFELYLAKIIEKLIADKE
ncbi:CdaR family transcriptional regulator [Halalkalibacter kiskunsagensis]|uniref:CdaR family transcriptional regulator n=1 Tax=Halalkalibacter kiskunsagensis TaxID=1548599 RepID=A0ABV6K6U7_9BACI